LAEKIVKKKGKKKGKKKDTLIDEAKKNKAELDELKSRNRKFVEKDKIKPRMKFGKKTITKSKIKDFKTIQKDKSILNNQIGMKSRQIKFMEGEVKRYKKLGIENSSSKISKENKLEYEFYKEKLRNESDELSKYIEIDDEIKAENLDISKGQAKFLKKIIASFPKKDQKENILEMYNKISEFERFEIADNWESWEKFYELATNYDELNQISAIMLFEKLNEEIGYVASKKEFLEITNVDESWINKEFKTWENFLELLGYDPWYRDTSKKKPTKINTIKNTEQKNIEHKNPRIVEDNVELITNMDNLKLKLIEYYKLKDDTEKYSDYSHVEMFELLEKYIQIIPNNPRFRDLKNYF
jgi:hypothetical protein